MSALDDPEDIDSDSDSDSADEAREAADQVDIDNEDEDENARPELVVTDADIKAGRLPLQKVRALPVD